MNKQAYDVGYAIGMLKSGSVERVERQNRKLFKIAKLLYKKGALKKEAFQWPWGKDPGEMTYTDDPEGFMAGVRREAESRGKSMYEEAKKNKNDFMKRQQMEAAGRLMNWGRTGGKMEMPDITKQKYQAPPWAKNKQPKEEEDYKPITLEGDFGPTPEPISIDLPKKEEKKPEKKGPSKQEQRDQYYDKYGQPIQRSESRFWGGPRFHDIQRYWMQMLGQTPAQLRANQVAQEAGYGRALQHRGNLDWLKSILLGPQSGHYGA